MQRDPFPEPEEEQDTGFVLDLLRSTIQKYFIVNDVRFDKEAFAFFIQLDPRTLEEDFDELRREMLDMGYVPMLLKEKPGYIMYVTRKPERQYRSIYINVAFLVATIVTVILAGMSFVAAYEDIGFWTWEAAGKGALYFAAPLMFILGVHEMGHYLMARRHRVAASLPFFIPAPTILGTFGAFISIREPIHSKRALMDIGFAGPITGFVAALFVTILGLKLSAWDPHPVGDDASAYWILGTPLVYEALTRLVPTPEDVLIHPTTFAGWVGFLITFLNLLPAGQLDGGHITRALFGDKAKYVGWATVGAMILFSWYFGFWGWIIFIIFIIFVLHHPPPLNDISPLPPDRWVVGFAAYLLLAICFVPAPFIPSDLEPAIEVHFEDPSLNLELADGMVDLNSSITATLVFVNTGNTKVTARIRYQDADREDREWDVEYSERVKFNKDDPDWGHVGVPRNRSTNFTKRIDIHVTPTPYTVPYSPEDLVFEIVYEDEEGRDQQMWRRLRVVAGHIQVKELPAGNPYVGVGEVSKFHVRFRNWVHDPTGNASLFNLSLEVPWDVVFTLTNASTENLTAAQVGTTLPLDSVALGNNDSADLLVWVHAPEGTPMADDVPVLLNVTPREDPQVTVPISFYIDIVVIEYDLVVSFDSNDYSAYPGDNKTVPFTLRSLSTVVVPVRLSYEYNGTDWLLRREPKEMEFLLARDETWRSSLVLAAIGEPGPSTKLVLRVEYGPDWQYNATASTNLLIVAPS